VSDTPRTLQEECYGTCWAACERIEELEAQVKAYANRIKRLEREVELLRLFGNKDCTAQADEVLKKEAHP
jgi:molecular chaperone GrpE (heat shock protein)